MLKCIFKKISNRWWCTRFLAWAIYLYLQNDCSLNNWISPIFLLDTPAVPSSLSSPKTGASQGTWIDHLWFQTVYIYMYVYNYIHTYIYIYISTYMIRWIGILMGSIFWQAFLTFPVGMNQVIISVTDRQPPVPPSSGHFCLCHSVAFFVCAGLRWEPLLPSGKLLHSYRKSPCY